MKSNLSKFCDLKVVILVILVVDEKVRVNYLKHTISLINKCLGITK